MCIHGYGIMEDDGVVMDGLWELNQFVKGEKEVKRVKKNEIDSGKEDEEKVEF